MNMAVPTAYSVTGFALITGASQLLSHISIVLEKIPIVKTSLSRGAVG